MKTTFHFSCEKCMNCGAMLDVENISNRVLTCKYCSTKYHTSDVKVGEIVEEQKEHQTKAIMINEHIVELEIYGEKRRFYIGSVEIEPIYLETWTISDRRHQTIPKSKPKMKIELIEM